jgi:hypothetical protein
VDAAGRWVVVELKAGTLYREVISQGIDYAACIRRLPPERLYQIVNSYQSSPGQVSADSTLDESSLAMDDGPREVSVIVVGTGIEAGLERISAYLSDFGVPIRALSFQVLAINDGQRLLVREVWEAESVPAPPTAEAEARLDQLLAEAERGGVASAVRQLYQTASRLGLYVRPYRFSIMFTPPHHHGRTLFTLWPRDKRFWAGSDAYAEFWPVTVTRTRELFGDGGWRELTDQAADAYSRGLEELFASLDQPEEV